VSTAPTAPATTTTTLGYPVYEAGTVRSDISSLQIYDDPSQAQPSRSLANPDLYGQPRAVFVNEHRGDWLNVSLPMRPNGSTGWIHASDVDLFTHSYHIVVALNEHQITVYNRNDVIMQEPVGVGRAAAPTPGGTFFTTWLLKPYGQPEYGPYAFGLSGYSEVYYSFGDGDGQFGIHGTNDPSSVGHDVSSGCIRMNNGAITQLADTIFPNTHNGAGVPVEIRA
jgi:hypothetical protein